LKGKYCFGETGKRFTNETLLTLKTKPLTSFPLHLLPTFQYLKHSMRTAHTACIEVRPVWCEWQVKPN